jgi:hypothetical protein
LKTIGLPKIENIKFKESNVFYRVEEIDLVTFIYDITIDNKGKASEDFMKLKSGKTVKFKPSESIPSTSKINLNMNLNDNNFNYFCVFCEGIVTKNSITLFPNEIELKTHMNTHVILNTDNEKLSFEQWLIKYIDYIKEISNTIKYKKLPGGTNVLYKDCPMCLSIINVYDAEIKNNVCIKAHTLSFKGDNNLKRGHISNHLKYFPYRCAICDGFDELLEICNPKYIEFHIQNHHKGLENSAKYWVLSHTIETIEKFIDKVVPKYDYIEGYFVD